MPLVYSWALLQFDIRAYSSGSNIVLYILMYLLKNCLGTAFLWPPDLGWLTIRGLYKEDYLLNLKPVIS